MFTRKQFEEFKNDTEQVMKALAEKYNVNIKTGKIKYADNNFTLALDVAKKEVNGQSFEQAEFAKHCYLFGLKPEDYRREFQYKERTYMLTGFSLRSPKMPIIVTCTTGGEYKLSRDLVASVLSQS